jgi:hypothetical protein
MIFRNPSGAPELGCDGCGCRWFDRMSDTCYECGEPVPPEAAAAFAQALTEWRASGGEQPPPADAFAGGQPAIPSRDER